MNINVVRIHHDRFTKPVPNDYEKGCNESKHGFANIASQVLVGRGGMIARCSQQKRYERAVLNMIVT